MTFSRDTFTAGPFTSLCDTCGDYFTSLYGPRVDRFEREHVCERRVA